MIVILHNIRSMHNVGSIFRTADAAGVEKIYLCGITPTPLDEFKKPRAQLQKVSLGAENYVEWKKYAQTYKVLNMLKNDGYKIFAIEQNKNSISYNKIKLSREKRNKTVLVLGHEINGLPKAILNKVDKILEIPMQGKKESLNVAVAFGIVVYSLGVRPSFIA